jgi:MFS family permease
MTDNSDDLVMPLPALFKQRDFVLFAISRGSSMTASQMLTVAVGWMLYLRTGDPFTLALVGFFRFLPFLLLFLWAGVVADTYSRPQIIGISNLTQAIAAGLIGVALALPDGVLWPVFLLLAVHGAAQAFLQPAQQSTLPNIVAKPQWARAVAVTSTIMRGAQLGGPALAGVLIAVADGMVFAVILALSILAATSAALIRANLQSEAAAVSDRLAHLLAGIGHIRRTPIVFGAITIDLVAVLFGGIAGLLPVFALDVLSVGPVGLGAMRAMPAIGGLAMGILLGSIAPPSQTGPLFFLGLGVFGLSIVVFALSEVFWVSLVTLAVYGATDMFSVYVRQTLVQLETPDALRGRVNAVNSVSINASNELGDFRAGTMAVLIGTVPAVALGGFVTLGAAALWWRLFPDLRRVQLA